MGLILQLQVDLLAEARQQLGPSARQPSDVSGILSCENAVVAAVLIWGSNPTRPEVSDPPSPSAHSEVSGTGCPNENYSHEQGLQGGNIKSIQQRHFLSLATEPMDFTHLSPLLFRVRA